MKEEKYIMRLNRPRINVGTKTFIAFSIVFWLPVAFLAGILFYYFYGILSEEVLNSVKIDLKGAKGVYEERVRVTEGVITEFSRRSDVVDGFLRKDSKALQAILLDFGKEHYDIDAIMAVNANRTVLGGKSGRPGEILNIGNTVSNALLSGEPASSVELVGKNFFGAEENTPNRHLKDIGLMLFVVSPVRDGERLLGAVVAGILLTGDPWLGNTIHNRFGVEMALFAGETSESLLLHSTSSVPRSAWVVGQGAPARLREEIALGRPYYGLLDIAETGHLVAFEPMKDSRHRIIGAIGVSAPSKKVSSIIMRYIGKGVAAVAGIGLGISVLITLLIHYDITRPLGFLIKAMDAFGRGEVGIEVDLKTGDQFEKLGQGFNTMAEGIRKREEKLKKHNEVAKLLMSTLDLKELLGKMVQIAVSVTDSHLGIVYLHDETDKTLVPNFWHGTEAGLPAMAMGEGYPGRAAADNKVLMVRPENEAEARIELGFAKLLPREAAYIPLAYQDKVHGVLVLGTLGQYREEERNLFEYLANQISIALDNALLHQQVQELSITDMLTGLSNRRYLNLRLSQEWARALRHGYAVSVLLADIDNFKSINDAYGHERGDEVLKAVSDVIRSNVRKEDLAARFGGEEFVVVLAGADTDEAYVLAERIRTQVASRTFVWLDRKVTISIGVATFPYAKAATHEEFLQLADQAMYKAKITGKNKVVVTDGKAAA